jgi:hypothetical protein
MAREAARLVAVAAVELRLGQRPHHAAPLHEHILPALDARRALAGEEREHGEVDQGVGKARPRQHRHPTGRERRNFVEIPLPVLLRTSSRRRAGRTRFHAFPRFRRRPGPALRDHRRDADHENPQVEQPRAALHREPVGEEGREVNDRARQQSEDGKEQ